MYKPLPADCIYQDYCTDEQLGNHNINNITNPHRYHCQYTPIPHIYYPHQLSPGYLIMGSQEPGCYGGLSPSVTQSFPGPHSSSVPSCYSSSMLSSQHSSAFVITASEHQGFNQVCTSNTPSSQTFNASQCHSFSVGHSAAFDSPCNAAFSVAPASSLPNRAMAQQALRHNVTNVSLNQQLNLTSNLASNQQTGQALISQNRTFHVSLYNDDIPTQLSQHSGETTNGISLGRPLNRQTGLPGYMSVRGFQFGDEGSLQQHRQSNASQCRGLSTKLLEKKFQHPCNSNMETLHSPAAQSNHTRPMQLMPQLSEFSLDKLSSSGSTQQNLHRHLKNTDSLKSYTDTQKLYLSPQNPSWSKPTNQVLLHKISDTQQPNQANCYKLSMPKVNLQTQPPPWSLIKQTLQEHHSLNTGLSCQSQEMFQAQRLREGVSSSYAPAGYDLRADTETEFKCIGSLWQLGCDLEKESITHDLDICPSILDDLFDLEASSLVTSTSDTKMNPPQKLANACSKSSDTEQDLLKDNKPPKIEMWNSDQQFMPVKCEPESKYLSTFLEQNEFPLTIKQEPVEVQQSSQPKHPGSYCDIKDLKSCRIILEEILQSVEKGFDDKGTDSNVRGEISEVRRDILTAAETPESKYVNTDSETEDSDSDSSDDECFDFPPKTTLHFRKIDGKNTYFQSDSYNVRRHDLVRYDLNKFRHPGCISPALSDKSCEARSSPRCKVRSETPSSFSDRSDSFSLAGEQDLDGTPPRAYSKRKPLTPYKSPHSKDPSFRGVVVKMKTKLDENQPRLDIKAYFSCKKTCRRHLHLKRRYPEAELAPVTEPPILPDPPPPVFTQDFPPREKRRRISFLGKQCASCSTKKTPLWRDAEDGTSLCNACGIRYKKYRVRCTTCWHIPRKDTKTDPTCHRCGEILKVSPLSSRNWT